MCGGIDVSTHSQLRYQKCLDAHGALRGRITNSSSTAQTPTGRSLESLSATLKSVFGSITLGSKKTNKSTGDSWICFPSGRRTFSIIIIIWKFFVFDENDAGDIEDRIRHDGQEGYSNKLFKKKKNGFEISLIQKKQDISPLHLVYLLYGPWLVDTQSQASFFRPIVSPLDVETLDVPTFLYFDFSDQSY